VVGETGIGKIGEVRKLFENSQNCRQKIAKLGLKEGCGIVQHYEIYFKNLQNLVTRGQCYDLNNGFALFSLSLKFKAI
jgi:hypothetical protein